MDVDSSLSDTQHPPRATMLTSTRIGLGVTAAVGAVTLVALLVYLVSGLGWSRQPFLGALFNVNMVVDGTIPLSQEAWPGLDNGVQRLDQLRRINDIPLAPAPTAYSAARAGFAQIMAQVEPGSEVTLDFDRPLEQGACPAGTAPDDPSLCRIRFETQVLPEIDFIGLFVAPFLTALVSFLMGVVVLALRPYQPAAQLISVTGFALALLMAGLFDLNTTYQLVPLWLVANPLLASSLILLGLTFPLRSLLLYERPWVQFAPHTVGLVAAAALVALYYYPPYVRFQVGTPAFMLSFTGVVIFTLSLLYNRRRATSLAVRDQSNTMLIGIGLSAMPVVVWIINMLAQFIDGSALFVFNTSAGAPFAIVAPLSMGYAVLQYRLLDTDRIISQGITYALMFVALVTGYTLLVFSASLFFTQGAINANNPLLIAVTIFFISIMFLPVRNRLQKRIDKLYFRERLDYQDYIEIFTHEISRMRELEQVIEEFRLQLEETIEPSSIFVFVPDRQSGDYIPFSGNTIQTDVTFKDNSGLLQALMEHDQYIYLEHRRPWPTAIRAERSRLQILDALLVLGLHGSTQLNGFICIGPPQSGVGHYNYEELLFVQSLVSQMAIAAERAQVIESLERRVQQLDVLSQVSQAANFTIEFDDLLELISTQTNRLIDARNFYIVLLDETRSELYYAFFLENDERYPEKENKRWPLGHDLYSEIVGSRQAIRVNDYTQALHHRGESVRLETDRLSAWMGVPLQAGTRMLGVIAAGMTENGRTYGADQVRAFGDISTLAATSIDKARLFAETNRRARQLTALNDISRQLAQELDIDKLLTLVTHSAVDILNAEAGALLLTLDDGSEQLEFRIAVGGAGQSLVGSRFPMNRGLAGEVATKGKPVIVNDASNDPRWAGEQASEGGFHTQAVLAVPLIASNKIVGVLELINKKDGGIYVMEDVNLLTTFASQAAIAIDNARLFQMTDQALQARVDELQIMERIDVELNRSLDLNRVAEITVRWAISQSGATAGVLGLLQGDPPYLQIVASYGYDDADHPEGAAGTVWPLDRGIVSRVMRTRQPEVAPDVSIDPSYTPSLRGSLSQLTVPMMSGADINAMLILETDREPRLNLVDLSFIQRLAEHASIALVNAQLYVDLARANDSKSEFVGFVAHELKVPMTSIRGYADLLMGGMVGDLNDQQQAFLGTIRSNVDRMNTLVSDLRDITQMEAKRLHMEFSPIDFRNVVTETLRPLQKQIEDKEQALNINLPEKMPLVMADQNRLIQVMTNLVSNAHKYTPPAGKLTIDCSVAGSQNGHNQDMLHVMVQDSGIGMSEEDLAKLFTPYFRSENPLAQEQPGTGLGLTITRGIIDQHGGDIWVESELNRGTAFHFTVPVAAEPETTPVEAAQPSEER